MSELCVPSGRLSTAKLSTKLERLVVQEKKKRRHCGKATVAWVDRGIDDGSSSPNKDGSDHPLFLEEIALSVVLQGSLSTLTSF